MLKKTIAYEDLDGQEQKDECYFYLSKTELTEMEVSERGGFEKHIQKMIEEKDHKKLFELFKEFVLTAYGEKSADGRSFIKKKLIDGHMVRIRDIFEQTLAFDALMMEFIGGGEQYVANFIQSVLPKELQEEIAKQIKDGKIQLPSA